MFVYELALEVGKTSGELVTLASAMGIDGLSPTSALTAAQVAELRQAVAPEQRSLGVAAPQALPAPAPVGAPDAGISAAGRGLRVVLVAVVVAVAGLFAFLAFGAGGSPSSDAARSSTDASATTVAGPTAPTASEAATESDAETSAPVTGVDAEDPIALDAARYCPAANTFTEIVGQLQAAGSYEASKEIVDARGDDLLAALGDMRAGLGASGPMLDPVADWYESLVAAVATSTTEAEYRATMTTSAADPEAARDAWSQLPSGCTFETVGERIEG